MIDRHFWIARPKPNADMNHRNLSIAGGCDHTSSSGENLFAARHELKDSNLAVERQNCCGLWV